MPTPYTGNPSAAQAPSPSPPNGGLPVGELPVDGDPPNAATWEQIMKMLTDFAAWQRAPFADSTQLNKEILRYRNALLQARAVVDHIGYNVGNVVTVDEDWLDVGKVLKNSIANGAWSGRWNYSISGAAAGRVEVVGPGENSFISSFYYPRTSCLKISTGTGGITPNAASVEMPFGPAIMDDDGDITISWPFMLSGSGVLNSAQGLTSVSQQGVLTEFVAQNVAQAVALVTRSGQANFQLYTRDGSGGASHIDDTGVAKDDAPHRVRLELRGANACDDSVARVRLFLDADPGDPPVVDRAILIGAPGGGTTINLLPFFKVHQTNVADHLWVGRLQFRGNTETGDKIY